MKKQIIVIGLGRFGTSLAKGARIDTRADVRLRQTAEERARSLCRQTGIDLAGIDLIFKKERAKSGDPQPLLLEINYFFGRAGLGGSERFYALLRSAVDRWLANRGLFVKGSDRIVATGERR